MINDSKVGSTNHLIFSQWKKLHETASNYIIIILLDESQLDF